MSEFEAMVKAELEAIRQDMLALAANMATHCHPITHGESRGRTFVEELELIAYILERQNSIDTENIPQSRQDDAATNQQQPDETALISGHRPSPEHQTQDQYVEDAAQDLPSQCEDALSRAKGTL